MKNKSILVLLLALVGSSPISAADFWLEEPYQSWSRQECEELLSDSPWAYSYALTESVTPGMMNWYGGKETASRGYGNSGLASQTGDREVHIFLQIRFLTARPIKAAVGRLRVLDNPEDKALKDQVRQYAEGEEGPEIAVEITYYSQPEGHWSLREVAGFLNRSTIDSLRNKTWISDSSQGSRSRITRYQGPSENYQGALLFFSRYDEEGKPLFKEPQKDILFHMETDFGKINLILDTNKMRYQDEFTF